MNFRPMYRVVKRHVNKFLRLFIKPISFDHVMVQVAEVEVNGVVVAAPGQERPEHEKYDIHNMCRKQGLNPYYWGKDENGAVYCYAERKSA